MCLKHLLEYFLLQPTHPPYKTHAGQPYHTDTDVPSYYAPDTLWLAPDTLWWTGTPPSTILPPPPQIGWSASLASCFGSHMTCGAGHPMSTPWVGVLNALSHWECLSGQASYKFICEVASTLPSVPHMPPPQARSFISLPLLAPCQVYRPLNMLSRPGLVPGTLS